MSFKTYDKPMKTGVLHILEYASEAWGYKIYKYPNKKRELFIFCLSLHRFSQISVLRGELGRNSTCYICWTSLDTPINWLLKLPESRLTHKLFQLDYLLPDENVNWSS